MSTFNLLYAVAMFAAAFLLGFGRGGLACYMLGVYLVGVWAGERGAKRAATAQAGENR